MTLGTFLNKELVDCGIPVAIVDDIIIDMNELVQLILSPDTSSSTSAVNVTFNAWELPEQEIPSNIKLMLFGAAVGIYTTLFNGEMTDKFVSTITHFVVRHTES